MQHETNWIRFRELFREGGTGISLEEFDHMTNKRIKRLIDIQEQHLKAQREEMERIQKEQERKNAKQKILSQR